MRILPPIKPKRKTWREIAKSYLYGRSPDIDCYKDFPCPFCGGYGKIRDPDDYDPIEGYKLAGWLKCANCDSKGKITKKQFISMVKDTYECDFDRQMEDYNKHYSDFTVFKGLLRKVNQKELILLEERFSVNQKDIRFGKTVKD